MRRSKTVNRALALKMADLASSVAFFLVWAQLLVGTAAGKLQGPLLAPASSVAIVPGSLVYADHTPSAVLADRLECARSLWASGKVSQILVSGDHGSLRYDEVNVMHDWLVRAGVPDNVVFLDHAGFRTLDTMQRAARVFGVREALVCRQASFLPRALFLARAAGIHAEGVVSDRRQYAHMVVPKLRERVAVGFAVAESVLGHGPRYLGPHIDLSGPAAVTHDR